MVNSIKKGYEECRHCRIMRAHRRRMEEKDIQMFKGEVWKTIDEAPNYLISNWGRCKNKESGRIMSPLLVTKHKYHQYRLVVGNCEGDSVYIMRYAHRLCAIAHMKNKPKNWRELDCSHLNDCKHDNHIDNLVFETRSQNIQRAVRAGKYTEGQKRAWRRIKRNWNEWVKARPKSKRNWKLKPELN